MTVAATVSAERVAAPPRGALPVWKRLLRAYGPVAALAVALLLVAMLVPSKVDGKVEENPPASVSSTSTTAPASTASTAPASTASTAPSTSAPNG